MDHFKVLPVLLCLFITNFTINTAKTTLFSQNYINQWGGNHVVPTNGGQEVQLILDGSSGAGFRSKYAYGSGFFKMSIKLPRNEKGVVTTFYLTSEPNNAQNNHNELDFEFLDGNILSTNIFVGDSGHREQTFKLWFDPSQAFHDYRILWNTHQIVFFVDAVPIRVTRLDGQNGIKLPKLGMYVVASIWDATKWRGPPNWSHAPFTAYFRQFDIHGCPFDNSNLAKCDSSRFPWNKPADWQLNPQQQAIYTNIKRTHMDYDYCTKADRRNYPECNNP